jgi:hypothetical protein
MRSEERFMSTETYKVNTTITSKKIRGPNRYTFHVFTNSQLQKAHRVVRRRASHIF